MEFVLDKRTTRVISRDTCQIGKLLEFPYLNQKKENLLTLPGSVILWTNCIETTKAISINTNTIYFELQILLKEVVLTRVKNLQTNSIIIITI